MPSRKNWKENKNSAKSQSNAVIFIAIYVLLLFGALWYYSPENRPAKRRIGTLCLTSDSLDIV